MRSAIWWKFLGGVSGCSTQAICRCSIEGDEAMRNNTINPAGLRPQTDAAIPWCHCYSTNRIDPIEWGRALGRRNASSAHRGGTG